MNAPVATATAKAAHIWQKAAYDWYVESSACTRALLSVERFHFDVWDPACGQGNIVRACLREGVDAFGTDIVDRSEGATWFRGARDFLAPAEDGPLLLAANIICNPPFYRAIGAEAFIRKALQIASRKVAMFLNIRFLTGDKRATGLFQTHPPTRVWILTPRPSCPPGAYLAAGNKAGGGQADWCWCVWDMQAQASGTMLQWLRVEG